MAIITAIQRAYNLLLERNWDKIYWMIDLHGVCFKSNYKKAEYNWINDDVLETLKQIQSYPECEIILWSSCHIDEQFRIIDFFGIHGIDIPFQQFNNNPFVVSTETGCFDEKPYFSVLIDDKAGFEPETDWKIVSNKLKEIHEES